MRCHGEKYGNSESRKMKMKMMMSPPSHQKTKSKPAFFTTRGCTTTQYQLTHPIDSHPSIPVCSEEHAQLPD